MKTLDLWGVRPNNTGRGCNHPGAVLTPRKAAGRVSSFRTARSTVGSRVRRRSTAQSALALASPLATWTSLAVCSACAQVVRRDVCPNVSAIVLLCELITHCAGAADHASWASVGGTPCCYAARRHGVLCRQAACYSLCMTTCARNAMHSSGRGNLCTDISQLPYLPLQQPAGACRAPSCAASCVC